MTPDSRPLPRAWLTVAVLWLAGCSDYLTRNLIVTMHGSLLGAIPMTEKQFGALTSVLLLAYAAGGPFGGFLADRLGRSVVIMASMLAWSLLTWLTYFARTFNQLLLLRALIGLSQSCYIPAAFALISDYHRGSTRSLATGLHMTGIVCGGAVAGLGGWLAERQGWSRPFQLIGLASVAYCGVLLLVLRDVPASLQEKPAQEAAPRLRLGSTLAGLFGSRGYVPALVFFGLQGAIGWVIAGWMPTYLHDFFKLGQGAAGFSATGYMNAAMLAGLLAGGSWADRWSRTNCRARIFVTSLGLALAAPGYLLAGCVERLPLMIAGLILWGVASGFMGANFMPILCQIVDSRYRATGYGVFNTAACVSGGLAIYAAGALRDKRVEFQLIWVSCAAAMAVCAALLLLVRVRAPEAAGPRKAISGPGG